MTGAELIAGSAALARFKAEEKESDVQNYTIQFRHFNNEIEVIFIPNQGPDFPKKIDLGGKTFYGRSVHYLISTINYEVIKRSFDR